MLKYRQIKNLCYNYFGYICSTHSVMKEGIMDLAIPMPWAAILLVALVVFNIVAQNRLPSRSAEEMRGLPEF